ncbi:MAG: hypothetical protein QW303_04695 [Nitrososphaerota archaeon]
MAIIDILYVILVILIAFILFNIGVAIAFVLIIALAVYYLLNLVRRIVDKPSDQISYSDDRKRTIIR